MSNHKHQGVTGFNLEQLTKNAFEQNKNKIDLDSRVVEILSV